MTLNEGNRVRNISTGKIYEVKKINRDWAVLQEVEGSSQVLTGKVAMEFTYDLEGAERNA